MPIKINQSAEETSKLIAIPEGYKITLSDGRVLLIRSWAPVVDTDSIPSVRIEAAIMQNEL